MRGVWEMGVMCGVCVVMMGEEVMVMGGVATATREDGDAATREAMMEVMMVMSVCEMMRKSDKEVVVLVVSVFVVGVEVVVFGGLVMVTATARDAFAGAARGLIVNYVLGVGGIIEDGFLGLFMVGMVYVLWCLLVIL